MALETLKHGHNSLTMRSTFNALLKIGLGILLVASQITVEAAPSAIYDPMNKDS
jgi:hypothetical protein